MPIKLYDSYQQSLLNFEPIIPGEVSIYLCGPTVQSAPHIGHLRSALVYDLWRNWFSYRGYRVTLVRNVTDIDDKILNNATAKEPWWQLAYRVEQEFNAYYHKLGILAPNYEPRATGHITQMIALIERLIASGHAYPAKDASGDVYFATKTWPNYGELTRQQPADMATDADADSRGKLDAQDFALWKGHKPGEPETASWSAPWGKGRPGWHIECSAMSTHYLGSSFDIHGGGLDLRFPHHENELAQSKAAGDGFAKYWLHNGLVNVSGQKMSKSLGNSIYAAEILSAGRPIVARYFLSTAHYRSVLEYGENSIADAEAAFGRIESFIGRAKEILAADFALDLGALSTSGNVSAKQVPLEFAEAMDDDLNLPVALSVLHESVRAGNTHLTSGDLERTAEILAEVLAMLDVLGLNPLDPVWKVSESCAADSALAELVPLLLEQRTACRAAKDFATADLIRDRLQAAGIITEDGAFGTRWRIDGS